MKRLLLMLLIVIPVFAQTLLISMLDGSTDSLSFSQDDYFFFSDSNVQVTRLIYPENAAVNVDVKPLFLWQEIEGKHYEFLLSQGSMFRDTLSYISDLDTNAYRYEAKLMECSKYYWKVRLKGEEQWTMARYFKTYTPPIPEKIESWTVRGVSGGLELIVHDDLLVDSLWVLMSTDGHNFLDTVFCDTASMFISDVHESAYYIKIAGVNSRAAAPLSEMLYATTTYDPQAVLIVQGFERQTTANHGEFILQHAKALDQLGYSVVSATNNALTAGFPNLNDFEMVDYILGEESTVDQTFSATEQALVKDYLQRGGNLFVSGAELAWDLDHKGSVSDKSFCHEFLHVGYFQDAPGGQSSTNYTVRGIGDTVFSALGTFSFDNGTHGSYNVRYADVFTPKNGAQKGFEYPGFAGAAGVVYEGYFPQGLEPGKIMVLGFPFETVYPESKRLELMRSFVEFSQLGLAVQENDIPLEHALLPNYPNPFNPKTIIAYRLANSSHVEILVFDISGKKVQTLVNQEQSAGNYDVDWDAAYLSSGVYFTMMKVDGDVVGTNKLTLMK